MIKYSSKNNNSTLVIRFNTETEEFDRVDCFYIDEMYWVPEDGEWTVKDEAGNTVMTKKVTAGDLVLRMYPCGDSYTREFFFVDNAELKDYARRRKAYMEKKKEEERNRAVSGATPECEPESF